MRKSLCLLGTWGIAASALALEAAERDPRIGTWIQKAAPGTAAVRQSFEDLGGGRFRLHLTGMTVEARCDGKKYFFTTADGKPAGPTYSCRVTGSRTVEYSYTQEGRDPWTTSTGTETVSEDGGTLKHVGVRRDAAGRAVENLTQEYRRADKP
jgi:hypothetical protein